VRCLDRFLDEVGGLEASWPDCCCSCRAAARWQARVAGNFFAQLRKRYAGGWPASPASSWFTPEADGCCAQFHVGRVAADPALSEDAARAGGESEASLLALARLAAHVLQRLPGIRPCRNGFVRARSRAGAARSAW
jgi:hypothetical protein